MINVTTCRKPVTYKGSDGKEYESINQVVDADKKNKAREALTELAISFYGQKTYDEIVADAIISLLGENWENILQKFKEIEAEDFILD